MYKHLVVLRDRAGDWHAVAGPSTWDEAVAQFSAVIGALDAIDYYSDFPPTVIKIIRNGQDYATATPLAMPCEECGVPVASESNTFALSALRQNVRECCEVRAMCACGQPVAVFQVGHDYDDKETHAFFAGAFLGHLDAEDARADPTGHALSLSIITA
ncbi:MAG: hypothetical protein ACXWQR_18440 [Ktedonobacterales bacterium]